MKYLKTYKLFESVMDEANVHIQMLEDILIDLKDEGCWVHVFPTPIAMANGVEPNIYVRLELKVVEDFSGKNYYSATDEELENIYPVFVDPYKRMVSYMESVGWDHIVPLSTCGYDHRRKESQYKMDVRFSRK